MPVIHTQSATPLEAVTLEPGRAGTTHVWLRKNIIQKKEVFDGEPHDVWEADEVYLHVASPTTLEYVQANFEALWTREANRAEPPPLEDQIAALYEAVGELGVLLTEGAF